MLIVISLLLFAPETLTTNKYLVNNILRKYQNILFSNGKYLELKQISKQTKKSLSIIAIAHINTLNGIQKCTRKNLVLIHSCSSFASPNC